VISLGHEFEALVAMLTLESVVKNIWPAFPADGLIEGLATVGSKLLESSLSQTALNNSNNLSQIRWPRDVELGA
jgi:hypothetical protein